MVYTREFLIMRSRTKKNMGYFWPLTPQENIEERNIIEKFQIAAGSQDRLDKLTATLTGVYFELPESRR